MRKKFRGQGQNKRVRRDAVPVYESMHWFVEKNLTEYGFFEMWHAVDLLTVRNITAHYGASIDVDDLAFNNMTATVITFLCTILIQI